MRSRIALFLLSVMPFSLACIGGSRAQKMLALGLKKAADQAKQRIPLTSQASYTSPIQEGQKGDSVEAMLCRSGELICIHLRVIAKFSQLVKSQKYVFIKELFWCKIIVFCVVSNNVCKTQITSYSFYFLKIHYYRSQNDFH